MITDTTPSIDSLAEDRVEAFLIAIQRLEDAADALRAADEAASDLYGAYGIVVADHGDLEKVLGIIESLRRHLV